MQETAIKILNRLSAAYPSFIELEVCRAECDVKPHLFKRAVAYLEEKALVELRDLKEGEADSAIYGDIRATAAGLDFLNNHSRRVRATFLR